MSGDSKVPDGVLWGSDSVSLTKDEAMRMDALRLALAVVFERGMSDRQVTPIAARFVKYLQTGAME